MQFFSVANKLCERRNLGFVRRTPKFVGSLSYWSSFERISKNGVPVDEQVLNGTVVCRYDLNKLHDLAVSQAVVGESKDLK